MSQNAPTNRHRREVRVIAKPKKKKPRRKRQKKQKHECVCCKSLTGTLALEDGTFICEDCAQAMSDLAP